MLLTRRRRSSEVALVAAAFALASACTVLAAHASPLGEIYVSELLRGELLAVGAHEFETFVTAMVVVAGLLLWLQRDFLIVSYDPETARVLGIRAAWIEFLLATLTGLAVSAGVLSVGPMVLFGLLVLPPIAARPFARSMTGFLAVASGVGFAAAGGGLVASVHFDAPAGPCVVVVAALLCVPAQLSSRG